MKLTAPSLGLFLVLSALNLHGQIVANNLFQLYTIDTRTMRSNAMVEVTGLINPGDWGPTRKARYDPGSTLPTNRYSVIRPASGVGRWIFDDCATGSSVDARWFGGKPAITTGWTNRLTWQQIAKDSRQAVQDAIDLQAANGGGIVYLGPGEWRFGDENNPGTLFLKPNVELVGAGIPKGDDGLEGTFSSTNLMRTPHATILHFSGGSTNGFGAPCISLVGDPGYTNQYYTAFTDLAGDWVGYYRGGNAIRNLGIYSGWKWPWNSGNPPGAAIYVNQVAGTTIDNVWIGPCAGPAIYLRGAFGTRVLNSIITTPLSSGIVLVDTSDTIIEGNTISAARGASIAIVRANTHIIRNNSFWNNAEDLVGWVGTSTTRTNENIIENIAVRRTGFAANAGTDLIVTTNNVGSDSGMPVFFRGTSLPGGVDSNTVYFIRWSTQGSASFYLTTTSGRALDPAGTVVDITSAGGSGTWWLEGPSGQIWLRDCEEIDVNSLRADQSFSGIVDAARVVRSRFSNIHAWEIGLNQTEVRQSRKQTWYDPRIIGFRFEDCNDITFIGNQVIGSKGNTSLSSFWDHVPIGVHLTRCTDVAMAGNTFDRLNTAIYADAESANVSTDGNQFGGWVSRAVDSGSSYGIKQSAPYFDARTNSQLVASIPSAFTNITGDFAIAIKSRVPEMTTNGWANGRHSALLNLTAVTNTTGYGALVPKSATVSIWRSILDNSMNLVTTLGGTNYDPATPSTERFAAGVNISALIGQDVEIVVQRSNTFLQFFVDGFFKGNYSISGSPTGNLSGIFAVVGQVGDSGQFSHPQSPIYAIAYHRQSFTPEAINKGLPWSRKGNTNCVFYWDFTAASQGQGVLDLSGNNVNATVQQIGAVAPVFGPFPDLMISGGANVTVTRTDKKTIQIASTAPGGGTNGSSISTNGGNTPGLPVVVHGDGTFGTTNSSTVSNLIVLGAMAIAQPIGSGSISSEMATDAEVAAGYQAKSANLTQIATNAYAPGDIIYVDSSTNFNRLPKGSDGQYLKLAGGIPSWAAGGGSFSYDVDFSYSITNTDTTLYQVWSNSVPDGQTRYFKLDVLQSGSTNGGSWTVYARISNRGGTLTLTNWGIGGAMDTNATAFISTNGTAAALMVRGPLYQPQNGVARGTYQIVTNAGAYSGVSYLTNGVVAYWAMTNTGSGSEPDLMSGANTLTVSAGDTINLSAIAQGGGRDFETGDDDYMVGVTNSPADLGSDTSFTLLCWLNMESGSVFKPLTRKPGSFSTSVSSGNLLQFTVVSPTATSSISSANIGTGTNYLAAFIHNATNNTISILTFEPAGPRFASAAHSGGTTNTGSAFWFSAVETDTTLNWDGVIGPSAFVHNAMPSNVIAKIYNSGSGLAFPWAQ